MFKSNLKKVFVLLSITLIVSQPTKIKAFQRFNDLSTPGKVGTGIGIGALALAAVTGLSVGISKLVKKNKKTDELPKLDKALTVKDLIGKASDGNQVDDQAQEEADQESQASFDNDEQDLTEPVEVEQKESNQNSHHTLEATEFAKTYGTTIDTTKPVSMIVQPEQMDDLTKRLFKGKPAKRISY